VDGGRGRGPGPAPLSAHARVWRPGQEPAPAPAPASEVTEGAPAPAPAEGAGGGDGGDADAGRKRRAGGTEAGEGGEGAEEAGARPGVPGEGEAPGPGESPAEPAPKRRRGPLVWRPAAAEGSGRTRDEVEQRLREARAREAELRYEIERKRREAAARREAEAERREAEEVLGERRAEEERRARLAQGLAASAGPGRPRAARARAPPKIGKLAVDAGLIADILGAEDDYRTLRLDHDASAEEVRVRYKQIVVGLHPDRCKLPRAQEAFMRVTKAHKSLLGFMGE